MRLHSFSPTWTCTTCVNAPQRDWESSCILRVWRSMEPLVAAHLHPRLWATSSRSPTHPAKANCFQYAMTEWAYKVASLTVRAFNSTSMLSAYQVEHDRGAAQTDPYSSVSQ